MSNPQIPETDFPAMQVRNSFFPKYHGWIGLGIILASEIALCSGVAFVGRYFTPLVWSGYVLLADSFLYRRKGSSLIVDRPGEFAVLLALSVGFWWIFEFYNLYIQNWHYVGLPEELSLRWFGYFWAFATIWPGILLTAEVLEGTSFLSRRKFPHLHVTQSVLIFSVCLGAFCLVFPLIASPELAPYLAAPVWAGFIFLLDPLNYWLGGKSLFRDLERGDPRVFYSLLLSGFVCGILWEFWNYWAWAKWHYTVPILGNVKIFEMPVLGYLGFPPFAVECYVMYAFVRNIFWGGRISNA